MSNVTGELVVAGDGGGQFATVQAALNAAAAGTPANPTVIRIRPGTYRELIYVMRERRFVRLVGEDPARTV